MKKNLLFLPLLFCTLSLFAQSLVGDNKQWYIGEVFITQPPVTSILKMEGDTLIDNKIYKKIYSKRDTVNQEWTLLNRFIREDSTKKVWLHIPNFAGDEEVLLFDFNLMVGDSFFIDNGGGWTCSIPVINVDSITLTSGERRKRITFSYQAFGDMEDEVYWIEGIGSQFGLLYHTDAYCQNADFGQWLRCYFEDGERQFGQVPDGECFYLITSTDDLEMQTRFSVYPNPAREQLTVILPNNQKRSWVFFNYQGQLVDDGEVSNTDDQISVGALPSGIYFLKIKDLGVQKIVIE